MRLKPFLPLILLSVLLTACQTDFHGDDVPAMESKSLKVKDAKAFFEEHRPTTTRMQGNTMSLGISERCTPDWSQAVESENEHLYCVEVPLTSGFKFVSTRKRKLGGKEIYLHQDVLRKLLVLKNKQTDEVWMGVMSLVPSVHFKAGKPVTSYEFHHFGDKREYSGLVIYNSPTGRLVTTDFYRHGERILHHHVSRENPRMDIATKIIGSVRIHAFNEATRMDEDGFWWCTTCGKYHHKDDDVIECAPVIIGNEICSGCLNEVLYCSCEWHNACPYCGELSCNCIDYMTCNGCGQLFDYCICSENICDYCQDYFCEEDHTPIEEIIDVPHDPARNHIICSDRLMNNMLNTFAGTDIGRYVLSKINQSIEVIVNPNQQKGIRVNFDSNGNIINISISENAGNDSKMHGFLEEIFHCAQICTVGGTEFAGAKLNYEIEAQTMVVLYYATQNWGDHWVFIDDPGMYNRHIRDLAEEYFDLTYKETDDTTRFDYLYEQVITYYRSWSGFPYANENNYPENPNNRNFNTFEEFFNNLTQQ